MRILAICIIGLLSCSAVNAEQRGIDITKIMSYFVISQVAADKCLSPGEDEKAKFAQNLLTVSIRLKQVVKERSPGKSDEVLASEINSFYSAVRKRYTDALEKAGCNSALGKQGISLWEVNVNWKPFKSKGSEQKG